MEVVVHVHTCKLLYISQCIVVCINYIDHIIFLSFFQMITHLETHCLDDEGILRVPGSSARLQSQKQEIDSKFNQGEFSFEGLKSSDVCSMLKMFIRELPIPVLTKEYLSAFASIPDIGDLKEQVRTLNLLVLLLPSVHQIVLKVSLGSKLCLLVLQKQVYKIIQSQMCRCDVIYVHSSILIIFVNVITDFRSNALNNIDKFGLIFRFPPALVNFS